MTLSDGQNPPHTAFTRVAGSNREPLTFQLDAYLPHWRAWWGKCTGRYWAMPLWEGAPDVLIEAEDLAELDEMMTGIEQAAPPAET